MYLGLISSFLVREKEKIIKYYYYIKFSAYIYDI